MTPLAIQGNRVDLVAYWFSAVAALGTTAILAPVVRRRLIANNVLDRPNARSSHTLPTPRGGGVACAGGVLSGALFAQLQGYQTPWGVVAAALLMALVGFIDDHSPLQPAPRLLAQILTGIALGALVAGSTGAAIGAILVPFTVNVVNFMDGINGLTATTATLWASTAVVVGKSYDQISLIVLGIITASAAIGFLPWNSPKAKLFLGDAGSYLFGTLIAGGVLLAASATTPTPPLLLAAPLAVYIFDVAITLLRRAWRRAPLMEAHREHIYQQLSPTPSSHLGTTLIIAFLTVTVVLSTLAPGWTPYVITAAILAVYGLLPKVRQIYSSRSTDDPDPRAGKLWHQ